MKVAVIGCGLLGMKIAGKKITLKLCFYLKKKKKKSKQQLKIFKKSCF